MNVFSRPVGQGLVSLLSWIGKSGRYSVPARLACKSSSIQNHDSEPRKYAVPYPTEIGETLKSFMSIGQKDQWFLIAWWCQYGTTIHSEVFGTPITLMRLRSCNLGMRRTGKECCNYSRLSRMLIYVTGNDESSLTKLLTSISETRGESVGKTIRFTVWPERVENDQSVWNWAGTESTVYRR